MTLAIAKTHIGPADHGRRMSLGEFDEAEVEAGYQYELDRGVIVVSDVPGIPHYLIVQAVLDAFFAYKLAHRGVMHSISEGSSCKMLIPPFDSERHPDISVYLDPPPAADVWSLWVPALVVEVVSESSRERDYEVKPDEYLQFGVREYWIVDGDKQRFTVLRRKGGRWEEKKLQVSDVHRTHLLPGFELPVATVLSAAGTAPPAA
jgi:Uma2 family endonuclease